MSEYRLILLGSSSPAEYNEVWIKNWEDFIESNPGASPFQTPDFFNVYLHSEKHSPYAFLAVDKNDKLAGSLLAVIHREYRGLAGFLSSRAIVTGDPVIVEDNDLVLSFLIGECRKYLTSDSILVQFRNSSLQDRNRKMIFEREGFRFDDHLNIILDLSKRPDVIWEGFSRSRKKGIKKAQSSPFEFRVYSSGDKVEKFYSLLRESYSRIGLPYPGMDHFIEICRLNSKVGYRLFSLEMEGKKIMMMLALLYNNRAYGYYAGTGGGNSYKTLKPADLFYWEVLKWCSLNGIESFDWMGAGKPGSKYGVRDFKLEFGGNTINPGRYERINHKLLYHISKAGLYLYRKMKFLR